MKRILFLFGGIVIFVISGIQEQFMFMLFAFFLLAVGLQKPLQKLAHLMPLADAKRFFLLGIATGVLTEILAIWNNLHLPPEQKALFHPDPGINIVLGLIYYAVWIIVWLLILKRYRFTLRQVFGTAGLFGMMVEQGGAVLLSFNPAMWLYAFLVHGSIIAIPYLLVKPRFPNAIEHSGWRKYGYATGWQFVGFISTGILLAVLR